MLLLAFPCWFISMVLQRRRREQPHQGSRWSRTLGYRKKKGIRPLLDPMALWGHCQRFCNYSHWQKEETEIRHCRFTNTQSWGIAEEQIAQWACLSDGIKHFCWLVLYHTDTGLMWCLQQALKYQGIFWNSIIALLYWCEKYLQNNPRVYW